MDSRSNPKKLAHLSNVVCLLQIMQNELDSLENLLHKDFKHELKRDTKALQKTLEKYILMVYKAQGGINEEAEKQLYILQEVMINAINTHTINHSKIIEREQTDI